MAARRRPRPARRQPRPARRLSGAQRRGGSARAPRQTFRPRPPQRFHRRSRGHASLAVVTRRRRACRRFPGLGAAQWLPQLPHISRARRCKPRANAVFVVPLHCQEAPPAGGPPLRPAATAARPAAPSKFLRSRWGNSWWSGPLKPIPFLDELGQPQGRLGGLENRSAEKFSNWGKLLVETGYIKMRFYI